VLCANRTGGRTCLRAGLDITRAKTKFPAAVWKEISVVIRIARLRWAKRTALFSLAAASSQSTQHMTIPVAVYTELILLMMSSKPAGNM